MRKFTTTSSGIGSAAFSILLGSLACLLLGWLPACSLLQKSAHAPHAISEEEYLGLCAEYGLYPHRSPDVPRTPIPFKTVAEARVYVAELSKFVYHQSDGKALYQLELRYPVPLTREQQTSLRLIELRSKQDIFAGSHYQGHRYAVMNPNDPQAEPRILEVLTDRKSQVLIEPGNDAVPRCLYASLATGAKVTCNFTGYAYLYTSRYHRLKGKSYLNGQVFAENVSLEARHSDKSLVKGSSASLPASANATNSTAECVRWIDYYASDGSYITTVCTNYGTGGGTWGGGGSGPVQMPDAGDDGSGGGGGGGGGGSSGGGGGGNGTFPIDDNPYDANGIAIITQPYGFFPGQNVQVTLQYANGVINYFESRLTGAEGVAQWIHQVGNQRSFEGGTFAFDIAFAVNKVLPSGYVVMYGPTHLLSGTYNVKTRVGYLAVPKYWD